MNKKVYQLYQDGHYLKTFEQIDNNEKDPNLLELKALSALRINRNESAKTLFESLLQHDKKASYYYHLGLSLQALKKPNKAIAAFKNSLMDSQFTEASLMNQAHCHIQLNNSDIAIALLIKLNTISPQLKQAWFLLLKELRYSDKLQLFSQKISESKQYIGTSPEWQKNQLFLFFYQNKYKKVLHSIKNIECDVELTRLKAKTYSKLADFKYAVGLYKELLNNDFSDINSYNLAAAYSKLTSEQDLSLSIHYAEECLKINSKYHQAYYCMALALQKLNKNRPALIQIKKAIKLDKKNTLYLYTKAELYKLDLKLNKSIKVLNKIIKIDAKYKLALRLKGIIKLQQNKLNKSKKLLKLALKIDSTDQRALAYYTINNMALTQNHRVQKQISTQHFVKQFNLDVSSAYDNLDSFNHDLEQDIKNHSLLRKNPNGLAARNGYLTDNLFADEKKSILTFKKLLLEKITQYIDQLPNQLDHFMLKHKTKEFNISSWATWVQGDGFIDKHIHEESWISGAYYCKVPKITESTQSHQGYFEYGCIPDDITINIAKEQGYIRPHEGLLVIFPSYMYHQTIPHDTNDDRISIAFDLTPSSWVK